MKKHVTLYGNSLSDPKSKEWGYLDQYHTIICSVQVFYRIKAKRPDLIGRCVVYFDFFCASRKNANPLYDILPCPGDLTDKKIYMKHRGGDSYLYYITKDWAYKFVLAINAFLEDNVVAGIFLDEWTISHTWWGIDAATKAATQVSAQAQRKLMTEIETGLLRSIKAHTTRKLLIANGEIISRPDVKLYHESAGGKWNPYDLVLPKTRKGDFWQINSSDKQTRFLATYIGKKLSLSIGMQPKDSVLNYNIAENTLEWISGGGDDDWDPVER